VIGYQLIAETQLLVASYSLQVQKYFYEAVCISSFYPAAINQQLATAAPDNYSDFQPFSAPPRLCARFVFNQKPVTCNQQR
jgi:hypothetical protein